MLQHDRPPLSKEVLSGAWEVPRAELIAHRRIAPMDPEILMGVGAESLDAAVHATEELEETAKLFLLLRNTPTRPLDAAQIDELRSVFKLDHTGES